MKVLVATNETQGQRHDDYSWTVEGELVTPLAVECASPDRCGCARGFPGLGSSLATTTAMVVELPGLTPSDLRRAVGDSLERDGWTTELDDGEVAELVDDHVLAIAHVCDTYPVGTVVSRAGRYVHVRPVPDAA